MLKGIARCALCGQTFPRDELTIYNFPTGPRLVCKECLLKLPPDHSSFIRRPDGKKRQPSDDFFPPVE